MSPELHACVVVVVDVSMLPIEVADHSSLFLEQSRQLAKEKPFSSSPLSVHAFQTVFVVSSRILYYYYYYCTLSIQLPASSPVRDVGMCISIQALA